jgi:hypothetical protein
VRLQSGPADQASAVAQLAKKKSGKAKHKQKKHSVLVTYASGSFNLPAGKSQAVTAKLSSSGKRLAHQHKRKTVWVNVTLTDTTPAKVSSHPVTLAF